MKRKSIGESPLLLRFGELDALLNSLLEAEGLPWSVEYRSSKMNYHRFNKIRFIAKGLFRLVEAGFFYLTYIRPRIKPFKKTGFFRSFKLYYYIFKIGLTDVIKGRVDKFDDKIPANYIIAAMLYDASCDVPDCRKYLKVFDDFIMFNKSIKTSDPYLRLFIESVDYLRHAVDTPTFEKFMKYIQIEHISQLMSIYQLSDKKISRDRLFKITLAKGGITILAGMHLMVPNLTSKERLAIYELGGVCQIFEDINDIEEDLKQGIRTLPNQKLIAYEDLKQLYYGTLNNLIEIVGFDPHQPSLMLDIFWCLVNVVLEKKYQDFLEKK